MLVAQIDETSLTGWNGRPSEAAAAWIAAIPGKIRLLCGRSYLVAQIGKDILTGSGMG